jgi:Fe-S cluster assembly iron-binding protein IscA
MLTVTDAAAEHLNELLDQADAPQEAGVRFVPGDKGVNLKLDHPSEADTTFDHNGRTVLMLDNRLSKALAGRTLDVKDTDKGQSLTIN